MKSLCRWTHSPPGDFSESLNGSHLAIYGFTLGSVASFDWPIQPVLICRFLFLVPFCQAFYKSFVLKMKEVSKPYCGVMMMIISYKSLANTLTTMNHNHYLSKQNDVSLSEAQRNMLWVRKGTLSGRADMGQIGQCSVEIMWTPVPGVLVSKTN